ncbi:MAG: prolyl oligopeptidase family serine peptidase [Vicinamibacterales bacterium]
MRTGGRCYTALPFPPAAASTPRALPTPMTYPPTKTVDQIDDYFGTPVADPYRWLEDENGPDTRAWIDAQNALTGAFLSGVRSRAAIVRRLTELWNYERFGPPEKVGRHYVYTKNDGLQNQPVLYKAAALDGRPMVLLDPNALSPDGTVALTAAAFSDDGRFMAYATSASGSDWMTWRVRRVDDAVDLSDVVQWSKFSGAAWRHDGSGFFYGRYEAPAADATLSGINKHHRVFFHALGRNQADDEVVYARPDQPDWMFDPLVTDDGRFLVVSQTEGTEPKNRLFVRDLSTPGAPMVPLLDAFDAEYVVVGHDGDRFYIKTDAGAPRGRLVAIDRTKPSPADWHEIVAEDPGSAVMSSVSMVRDTFVVVWMEHAHERIRVYGLDGAVVREVDLPGLGTVGAVHARRREAEGFFAFTSYIAPTTIHRYDADSGTTRLVWAPSTPFDALAYETTQVFYPSKDGTSIPLFVTARKGLPRDGRNPTILYGYGGFNISLTPAYSPAIAWWLEQGGVYAVANLRGGGEYGKAWHDAGRLERKQNVFDDFIAAAEHLIRERFTSTPALAISGGSNGGLLVGACMTQRPDLFGAALPAVGVLDMLRFHRFTIGWAWTSDYGSAETPSGFDTLFAYSPLHRLERGVHYPATLVTTADHDDRVVPAHSFKFAAALQAAQGGEAPVLIRIETKAGHGAGKPTSKQIEERADVFAFLVEVLEVTVRGSDDSASKGASPEPHP